jgi:hypothetical protein
MKYQGPTSNDVLLGVVLVCGVVLAVVDGEHILKTQLPTGWDEALYINDVCAERFILAKQGVLALAKSLISLARHIPPGYRMAAIPTFLIMEPNPALLKAVALASLVFSAVILFFAGRQIASPTAGAMWASAFSFSVGPFMAETYFGTEATLYPAVADFLPFASTSNRCQNSRGHGRFQTDESTRRRYPQRYARALPVHSRHGELDWPKADSLFL